MSSVQLLDRTRKIGKLLHNNNSSKVVFNDICKVMREILVSNVLVISRKGKILGVATSDRNEVIAELLKNEVGSFIDPLLNERLLSVLSTKENVNLATLGFENQVFMKFAAVVSPIEIAGERLGTLFLYRHGDMYDIDDIILCEYGTTVVGLEMLRSVSEESAEESRKIADRAGITRSVIVNALRKFESAGIIESRSSGMKGTYIKVRNDVVFEEVRKMEENMKS